jgi:hypothetical protein
MATPATTADATPSQPEKQAIPPVQMFYCGGQINLYHRSALIDLAAQSARFPQNTASLAIAFRNVRNGYRHNTQIYTTSITLMVRKQYPRIARLHPHAWVLSSQVALKAKLGTISQEAQSKLEEDTAKKEAKAEAKADAARKKKLVRSQNLIESHLAN